MSARSGSSSVILGRIPFTAPEDRPKLQLPAGARVAVWIILNIEVWDPNEPMPRTILPPPMGVPRLPDIPNWAWHEYGMRQGFWRVLDCMSARGLRATLALNGKCCEVYEKACSAALEAGFEFMGHGFVQKPMHEVENQAEAVEATITAIRDFTGRPPRGWESPGLTETAETSDLLAAAGIEYVADWVLDDQPVDIHTRFGRLVSVPYTVEINDVVISAVERQPSDEIYRRGRDHFDRLYKEGAESAKVMAISIHPYLTGVPHRIKYLEELLDYISDYDDVVFWTGEEILDWYKTQVPQS